MHVTTTMHISVSIQIPMVLSVSQQPWVFHEILCTKGVSLVARRKLGGRSASMNLAANLLLLGYLVTEFVELLIHKIPTSFREWESEQPITIEPNIITSEQAIIAEILSLLRENIRRSEQFWSDCEACRRWSDTYSDSHNDEINRDSTTSVTTRESDCLLKSSIKALDTKVTTDLTYIHTSEPVVFPSSMVSFDSFYHDLDDEEPLEVEDEDEN